MIKRIYVEKRPGFDVQAQELYHDLKFNLGVKELDGVRIFVRYDVQGITDEQYEKAKNTIFAEPQVDNAYDEQPPELSGRKFAVEYLPGQYDQRADFAEQCLQMLTGGVKPRVSASRLIVTEGDISDAQFESIKQYCINAVESREAALDKPETLEQKYDSPPPVSVLSGFTTKTDAELEAFVSGFGLAMDASDIKFCQKYFREVEKRDPTITEIRVLDTYWSDHCRHTTFLTELDEVKIDSEFIKKVFDEYTANKNPNKPVCLMDMATSPVKLLKSRGLLDDLDESEEINACSINVTADVNGKKEPWLVMFKNETHNHPTEIEPFGGAATCLGGAIRDPLSGRSYVYQAMRVTGSGDPTKPVSQTLSGKLPQRKISKTAASGFSSYGNQIGLATGQVAEIYHDGYVAKRMEIGAVIAAAPKENVVREIPAPGDVIILLGGRTGRDGCGGATGSSKAHDETSLDSCGAEVQKGNPPEERKIERFFRRNDVTTMIKRCNDFGAGGVSVAIGELADGLIIDLDAVPKKYEGLDGTELAISESQERMAIVTASDNVERFIALAREENLEATRVAVVTESPRLVMKWRGGEIVNISREFLDSNGAARTAKAHVADADASCFFRSNTSGDVKAQWLKTLASLRQCSQKGLVEIFDSSIGRGSVLMPFGGKTQLTPTQAMAAKLPVEHGDTTTATIMAYGYDPHLSSISPFHGAVYAMTDAAAKVVATGGKYNRIRYSLQEYFERLGNDPKRWGKPVAALLGAYHAQTKMGLAAIGGKDSMSGSFLDIDVPPTLTAFAVCPADVSAVTSNEFKQAGSSLVLISPQYDENNLPDFADMDKKYSRIHSAIKSGAVLSAYAVGGDGLCELAKCTFGNNIGIELDGGTDLFTPRYGAIVLETVDGSLNDIGEVIGKTVAAPVLIHGTVELPISEAVAAWQKTLDGVFPLNGTPADEPKVTYNRRSGITPSIKVAKPRVFIPVFPGTNCEYDTTRAFEQAGAEVETFVIKNFNSNDIKESIDELTRRIDRSNIVMLAGGFSAGDEPDGSAKFIATAFRSEQVKNAVTELLQKRDGLMLGICNGFQALIKLGLVPFGEIRDMDESCPTLTYNTIGRHISSMAKTRVASVLSPWLANCEVGDEAMLPVSHGEGRFAASEEMLKALAKNGQIATQYADVNINGSVGAVEGITSPDGRVFGKMAHNERIDINIAKNIPGNKTQGIFEAGVRYFG